MEIRRSKTEKTAAETRNIVHSDKCCETKRRQKTHNDVKPDKYNTRQNVHKYMQKHKQRHQALF